MQQLTGLTELRRFRPQPFFPVGVQSVTEPHGTDLAGYGARKTHSAAKFSMAAPGFSGRGCRSGRLLESQPNFGH